MAEQVPPPGSGEAPSTTDGQTAAANGGLRSWERPWTLDEMRKGAGNWSLAGDAGLLQYLQDFSQKMISRTHEIEKEVDNMVHESKMTGVRANNVFNDFIMLANTQFVENRVYDEDVVQDTAIQEEKKVEETEKTREQREAELIPKVTEAIKLGVDVIEQAFEKLDTNFDNSDSEDDEDTSYRVDPILEAKDPYIHRSLPLLIGTPNFMNDDNVGLEDISEDEETDHGSLSESESESESEDEVKKKDLSSADEYSVSESESDSDSETEKKKARKSAKKIKMVASESEESDSEGDLFGNSAKKFEESEEEDSESEEEVEETPKKPSGGIDFASELARKLGGKPASPIPADDEDDEPKQRKDSSADKGKKKKSKKSTTTTSATSHKPKTKEEDEEEDLFGGPPDDEDDDLFGGGGGGLFSKKSMFDDEDDEKPFGVSKKEKKSSISKDEPEVKSPKKEKRSRTHSGKNIPAGGVSIFGGGDKGLFPEKDESAEDEPVKVTKPITPAAAGGGGGGGGGGLFIESDDEDDLFGSGTKKPDTKKADGEKKVKNLFADDEDEDSGFPDQIPEKKPVKKEPPKKKMPAGAVSMFGAGPNPVTAALKKQRPDSEEEDNDWSGGEKSRSGSLKSNQSSTSKQSNKMSSSQSKDSLFQDDPDDALFSSSSKPKANSFSKKGATSLFHDDEDDDLFGTKPPEKKVETKTKPKVVDPFDDDDNEDEILSPPKKEQKPAEKKRPPGAVSMFGGVDLFSKKKEPEVKKEEPPAVTKPRTLSLFGEDEDGEEDLFSAGPPKHAAEKQKPKATPTKASALFDDGGLFGENEEEEDPSVDIFNKSPVKSAVPEHKKPEPNITTVTKPVPRKATPGKSLFDNKDEDDLFGSAEPKNLSDTMDVLGATTTQSTDTVPEKKVETPAVTKQRKPVGGVSMFGGINPFSKPSKPLEKDEEDEVKVAAPKPQESKPIKSAVKDPLFGGDDDEDLFAKPAARIRSVSKPKPVQAKVTDKAPSLPVTGGPLMADDEDDDMFGSSVKKTEPVKPVEEPPASPVETPITTPESPTVVKPKRPPGAVPMFGGMDPFAAMKKKTPATEEPPSSPNEDLFGSDVKVKEQKTEPKPIHVTSPSSGKPAARSPVKAGLIGKLQAGLAINPAAMMPGAAPPVKEPEPITIGFDVPAEVKTLASANKDRAKIQGKRRPPTRHARKSAAMSPTSPTDDFFSDISGDSSSSSPIKSPELPRVPSPTLEKEEPPSTRTKTDLFGNEDLFGGDSSKRSPLLLGSSDTQTSAAEDMFSDDIFSKKSEKKGMDDLFNGASLTADVKDTTSKSDVVNNDNNDLFASVPKKQENTQKTKTPVDNDDMFSVGKPSAPSKTLDLNGTDDDLFSSSVLSNKKSKSGVKSKNAETKDKSSKDDDDIFGNLPPATKKDPPKSSPAQEDDIFGVGAPKPKKEVTPKEDDVFASEPVKADKKKPKKAITKDEDLFNDDTDIFAGVPATKPKEKKKKTKITAAAKKPIFKEDIDDIFADTTPTKPKEKKEKKKITTKEKTKTTPVEDIFDNPLGS